MRVRKKLIFLHTCFSLVLAGILGLALRPAIGEVLRRAELHEADLMLRSVLQGPAHATEIQVPGHTVEVAVGSAADLGLDVETATQLRAKPAEPTPIGARGETARAAVYDPARGQYIVAAATLADARSAIRRLYALLTLALLAVYGLVAAALEVFVLPRHVYEPIRRLLEADRAVKEGRPDEELIPAAAMPADELGAIMRSRNETILAIRRHERDLAAALMQLEQVATDLKRKNHMLETARRNLADADRLASLGMMSAGLSHEMNTPLAVLKGLVEKLAQPGGAAAVTQAELALMLRVVGRLERLSESLLDFARARPPHHAPTDLRPVIDEAWTLVLLDREARGVMFENAVAPRTVIDCDPDRMLQVMVNLLRNAVDALHGAPAGVRGQNGTAPREPDRISVRADALSREGRDWVAVTIVDNGPGIDPDVLGRLFEPFVSTRLDAHGTGLGLAVAEGIVREHGGLVLARNREDGRGAVFEVLLPLQAVEPAGRSAGGSHDGPADAAIR